MISAAPRQGMVHLSDSDVSKDHPLALELSSLKASVARFQAGASDEAHAASVKLQRHSLDTASAHDRLFRLERENDVLKSEIATLRANPHPDSSPQAHPAALQVQQLTLSLRRLSDKLSVTEDALLMRTTELAHATTEAVKARFAADGAYELAARTRGREEAGKIRELELEWKVKAAEENMKMSDLVVTEYADLVRSMEAKASVRPAHSRLGSSSLLSNSTTGESFAGSSSGSLSNSLFEGKLGLRRLLTEFSTETETLRTELVQLQGELATSETKVEAERKAAELSRLELAKARFELQGLKIDDNVAAKMVSRYMKFSQKSTDTLQDALNALRTRHSSTINTLTAQLSDLSTQLQSSEGTVEKLRSALDEIGADIMKEAYGRRREVALRIRIVNREENLREELERWVLRAEEALNRDTEDGQLTQRKMIEDARKIILSIDGSSGTSAPSGSLARLISAQNAIEELSGELEIETAKRLELERLLDQARTSPSMDRNDKGHQVHHNGNRNGLLLLQERSSPDDKPKDKLEELPLEKSPRLNPIKVTPPDETVELISEVLPKILSTNDLRETVPTYPQVPPEVPILDQAFESDIQQEQGDAQNVLELQALEGESAEADIIIPSSDASDLPIPFPLVGDAMGQAPSKICEQGFEGPDDAPLPPASSVSTQNLPDLQAPGADRPLTSLLEPSSSNSPHPLLINLLQVSHRYDELQRAFRNCHLALEALKTDMSAVPSTSRRNSVISNETLQTALERLNDYTEDARVELEIRAADEALMARGFEALLSVPGALSSPYISSISIPPESDGLSKSAPTQSEVERQIEAFTSGTDPGVAKSQQSLSRKLDDIQHDIAALKRAVHDVLSPSVPSTALATNEGGGWTSWIRNSPSMPSSPSSGLNSGPGPAPTFGNVMTTPRLRHSPSLNFPALPKGGDAGKNPFAILGLRVPMPTYVHIPQTPQRSRTVSTMYMLGLGARKPSGSFTSPTQQHKSNPPPRLCLNGIETGMETGTDSGSDGDDSDVE